MLGSKIKAQFCSGPVPLSTAPVYRTQQTQLTGVAFALLQKTIVSALSDNVCLELALIMQLLFMWEYCITCEVIKCFIKCVPCEQVDALRTSSDIFLFVVFSLPLCQPHVKPKFFYKYNLPTLPLLATFVLLKTMQQHGFAPILNVVLVLKMKHIEDFVLEYL